MPKALFGRMETGKSRKLSTPQSWRGRRRPEQKHSERQAVMSKMGVFSLGQESKT